MPLDPLVELLMRSGIPPTRVVRSTSSPFIGAGDPGQVVRADTYRPEDMFPVMTRMAAPGGGGDIMVRETDPQKIAQNLNLLRRQLELQASGPGQYRGQIWGDTLGQAQGSLLNLRKMNMEALDAAAQRQLSQQLAREKIASDEKIAQMRGENSLEGILARAAAGGTGMPGRASGARASRGNVGDDSGLGDYEWVLKEILKGGTREVSDPTAINFLTGTAGPAINEAMVQQKTEWDKYLAELTGVANKLAGNQRNLQPTVDPQTGDVIFQPLPKGMGGAAIKTPPAQQVADAYESVFNYPSSVKDAKGEPLTLGALRQQLLTRQRQLSGGKSNLDADIETAKLLFPKSTSTQIDPQVLANVLEFITNSRRSALPVVPRGTRLMLPGGRALPPTLNVPQRPRYQFLPPPASIVDEFVG